MSDDEIFDDAWPATVARDEMFQRVTARGARLKATRRAVTSLLMVGSLLGAGAIGAGAIGSMGQPSQERGDVPELAGPVLRGSPDATAVPGVGDTIVDRSDDPTTTIPGGGAVPVTTSVSPTVPTTTGSATTVAPGTSTPTTVGSGTTATTLPSTTATTAPQGDVLPPGSTVLPPSIGVLRLSADRLYSTGSTGCAGADTAATVTVSIKDATAVFLTWGTQPGSAPVPMTWDGSLWQGSVGPFPTLTSEQPTPVVVVVTAVGPGGRDKSASTVTVEACPRGGPQGAGGLA